MELVQKHNEKEVLVRWNYSHEEWKYFLRWKQLRKSLIHYFIHLLRPKQKRIPEVMITHERVWIDECHEPFHTDGRQLKRVNIQDEGNMNIMAISYEQQHQKGNLAKEIKIPVPKGKLREAMYVQDKLTNRVNS